MRASAAREHHTRRASNVPKTTVRTQRVEQEGLIGRTLIDGALKLIIIRHLGAVHDNPFEKSDRSNRGERTVQLRVLLLHLVDNDTRDVNVDNVSVACIVHVLADG